MWFKTLIEDIIKMRVSKFREGILNGCWATKALSAPDGPHVGPVNLAIWEVKHILEANMHTFTNSASWGKSR